MVSPNRFKPELSESLLTSVGLYYVAALRYCKDIVQGAGFALRGKSIIDKLPVCTLSDVSAYGTDLGLC